MDIKNNTRITIKYANKKLFLIGLNKNENGNKLNLNIYVPPTIRPCIINLAKNCITIKKKQKQNKPHDSIKCKIKIASLEISNLFRYSFDVKVKSPSW